MKRILFSIIIILLVGLGIVPNVNDAFATEHTSTSHSNQDQSLSKHKILHTNDIHGRFVEEKGRVIGMPKLKGLKNKENPDLVLDSGDAFQGLPVSNHSKGEEMAEAMNTVGYNAMAIGNHEFDFGYNQLLKLQSKVKFPMLSSNIYKNGKRVFKPSTVIKRNGVRYGIIGVTTPETKIKTSPDAVKNVEFKDPLNSVRNAMKHIDGKVDVYIVLSHLGIDKNTKEQWRGDYLTDQLSKDKSFKQPIIVLDGHSHTAIKHGMKFHNDILAQTGTALENVGKIDFTFNHGKVSDLTASLINVKDTNNVKAGPALEKQVNKANDEFKKQTSTVVIPNNKVELNGERNIARKQETNLGNLITDAMEDYATKNFKHKPDFAITNSGGIRASISKGKVTKYDIISVLPFGNLISQIKVKGSDVKKAFEHSLSAPTETKNGKKQLSSNGGFLQVSKSIRVYYDINQKSGSRVKDIQVVNHDTGKFEKLDPNKTYYVATNDFTASKGDGYDMFGGKREEGISLDEVVGSYIQKHDLSKYNTTHPVRVINGKPSSAKKSTSDSNQHTHSKNSTSKTAQPHKKSA